MIAVWITLVVGGLVVASAASKRAVVDALAASQLARVSPALIGITVLAVGTDLPEIANSIVSAVTGHGDLNVGDGAGSALTQVTLILAILCVVMRPVSVDRRTVGMLGGLSVVALALVALLVSDERFGRWDGALLVTAWIAGLLTLRQVRPVADEEEFLASVDDDEELTVADPRAAVPYVLRALAWLGVVAVAATVVVRGFVELTDWLGVPELVASAIVLALGTSLPELIVDLNALRQGAAALAIGDLFGSSLVDSSLALGIGPSIRATVVSPEAWLTCLIAAAGVALATLIAARRTAHGRASAAMLTVTYLAATVALLVWTSGS